MHYGRVPVNPRLDRLQALCPGIQYHFSFNVSSQFPEGKHQWKGKLGFIQLFLKIISLIFTAKSFSTLLARIRPFLSLASWFLSSSMIFPVAYSMNTFSFLLSFKHIWFLWYFLIFHDH